MIVSMTLRNENDQQGNTWFSHALGYPEADVQVHMPRELFVSMGSPELIDITLSPRRKEDES